MRWAETRVETEGKRRTLLVKAIFPIAGKTDVFSFPRKDPPVGTSWPFLVCLFKAATRAPSLIPIIHFYLETKFRVTRSQFAADLLGKGPDSGVDYLFHCEEFNDVKRIREEWLFLTSRTVSVLVFVTLNRLSWPQGGCSLQFDIDYNYHRVGWTTAVGNCPPKRSHDVRAGFAE